MHTQSTIISAYARSHTHTRIHIPVLAESSARFSPRHALSTRVSSVHHTKTINTHTHTGAYTHAKHNHKHIRTRTQACIDQRVPPAAVLAESSARFSPRHALSARVSSSFHAMPRVVGSRVIIEPLREERKGKYMHNIAHTFTYTPFPTINPTLHPRVESTVKWPPHLLFNHHSHYKHEHTAKKQNYTLWLPAAAATGIGWSQR